MKRLFRVFLFLLPAMLSAQDEPWQQIELSEPYMRALQKDQCIGKTIATMEQFQVDDQLLTTLAGITGDCVTWAKGSEQAFCETFKPKFIYRFCNTNRLDAHACNLLHVSYEISCTVPKY